MCNTCNTYSVMKTSITTIEFEIIWKSIHGELNPMEQHQLDQWLAQDPKHRAYYQQAQKHYAQETISTAKPQVESLWEEIAKQETAKPKTRYVQAIAASIVLVLGAFAGYILWQSSTSSPSQSKLTADATTLDPGSSKAVLVLPDGKEIALGNPASDSSLIRQQLNGLANINQSAVSYKSTTDANTASAYHTLNIPRGGEFQLLLSDGTKVWLNSQSSIHYPIKFNGDKRVVQLTGEAYFEVAKNEDKPFEVITGNQTIRVLGTSFNVNYYPEDEQIVSTLLEGKIQVNSGKSNTIMTPGEQVIYDIKKESITKKEVIVENFIAWKNGEFYFHDRSLEHIMKVLARWYNIEVFYENGTKRDIRFTGSLKRYKRFEEVVELIEATDDVKFEIKENVIIIE